MLWAHLIEMFPRKQIIEPEHVLAFPLCPTPVIFGWDRSNNGICFVNEQYMQSKENIFKWALLSLFLFHALWFSFYSFLTAHVHFLYFSVFIAQHVYIQYTFRTSHPHTFELSAFTKHSVLAEERHLNLDGVFRATLISRDYKVFLQTPLHRIQRQNQVSMD